MTSKDMGSAHVSRTKRLTNSDLGLLRFQGLKVYGK